MFNILITDDEQEEREGIAFLLEEFNYPLKIFFANNGKRALQCLENHSIDILFTDVRMPIMDGLELCKHARELDLNLEIILYTGYSEFDYAKRAITLRVSDYILKPLNIEEFKQTIDHVIHNIVMKRDKAQNIAIQEDFAKKHLLYNAINYPTFFSNSTGQAEKFFQTHYSHLLLLEFDKDFFDEINLNFEEVIMKQLKLPADYLNLNMCQSLFLFHGSENYSEAELYEKANDIHNWITNYYHRSCYLALSKTLYHIEELPTAFAQLEQLIEYRFCAPDTFLFDENHPLSDYLTTEESDTQLLKLIQKDLELLDFTHLNLHLDIFYKKYQNKVDYSQIYIKFIFSSIYKDIITGFQNLSEIDFTQNIDLLYKSNDLKEMISLIKKTAMELEQSYSATDFSSSHEIKIVKNYIIQHYDEDLDLITLAEKVYLSPTYLCTLFKKTTGCGINKYIKNVRMEKAKELLSTSNTKIIDICTAVGFHNLSYFCQNFREFYGETPEKYRKLDLSHMRIVSSEL